MWHKAHSIIKRIDVFKESAPSYSTHRNKKTNEKKYHEFHGSILGGIVSIFFIALTLSYIET